MKPIFIILLVVFLLLLLAFLFGPIIKRKYIEVNYKKIVSKTLYKYALDHDVFLINDIKLPYNGGFIIFDHILFGEKYIYCIKDIHESFGIEGSAEDLKWFTYSKKGKVDYIVNPFKENNHNVSLLMKYMNSTVEDKLYFSIVCVNDDCDRSISKCRDDEIICKNKELYKVIKEKEKDSSIKNINQDKLGQTVKFLFDEINKTK